MTIEEQMIDTMQLLRVDYEEVQVATAVAQGESAELWARVQELRWRIRRLSRQIGRLSG